MAPTTTGCNRIFTEKYCSSNLPPRFDLDKIQNSHHGRGKGSTSHKNSTNPWQQHQQREYGSVGDGYCYDDVYARRISKDEVLRIVRNPQQFRKLQQILRDGNCVTNETLRWSCDSLLRERLNEMDFLEHSQQPLQRQRKQEQQYRFHLQQDIDSAIEFMEDSLEEGKVDFGRGHPGLGSLLVKDRDIRGRVHFCPPSILTRKGLSLGLHQDLSQLIPDGNIMNIKTMGKRDKWYEQQSQQVAKVGDNEDESKQNF